jgi:hypothetical protein
MTNTRGAPWNALYPKTPTRIATATAWARFAHCRLLAASLTMASARHSTRLRSDRYTQSDATNRPGGWGVDARQSEV